MSERIDVQADTTIVGAGGDAVREVRPALTRWVDAAPVGTRGHYARCVRLLARLRLLASQDAGAPLPPGAAGEVGHTARAIVAEADAAGHAVVAAVAEHSRRSAAVFLAPRQARLAAAAADIVAAAEDGSAAALSRNLCRFEALTSALWTVQRAICAPAHRRPRAALLPAPAAPKESRAVHPQLHLDVHLEGSHGRP
jgi:hypothetical protein